MIIGISGCAGVGKDTAADVLVQSCGFVKVSLSDPMKRFCRDVFDFTNEDLWGPSERRNAPCDRLGGLTPRHALQTLGTEWGRACHEDAWVNLALQVARTLLFPTLEGDSPWRYKASRGLYLSDEYGRAVRGVVIPDVRFQNELQAIQRAGGKVIRLRREVKGLDGTAGTHVSESGQTEIHDSAFDAVVDNTGGSRDELRLKVLGLPWVNVAQT